ncbi:putative protein-synthesizing GTPase [Dioscorea sansibarensis]
MDEEARVEGAATPQVGDVADDWSKEDDGAAPEAPHASETVDPSPEPQPVPLDSNEEIQTSLQSLQLEPKAKDKEVTKPEIAQVPEGKDEARKRHLNVVFIGHMLVSPQLEGKYFSSVVRLMIELFKNMKKKQKTKVEKAGIWPISWTLMRKKRVKGKTVEVGRAHFETENTRFTILDAPGHKSYVPNMISGASQADVGVLVISARKGEFETGYEKGGQTREHVQLAKTLGVSKLVVVVNKMDDHTVGWSKERFDEIESKMIPFLRSSGYNVKKDVQFLPISGLVGTNMKTRVDKKTCGWWDGPCLFEVLDSIQVPLRDPKGPLRMPIIDKYKDMGTVVMGKVESGSIQEGDSLLIMPNKAHVKVVAVYCDEDKVSRAGPGENLRVKLSGIEEEEILTGFVLSSVASPVPATFEFKAQLQILELVDNAIFTAGYKAVLHIHAVSEECEIVELIEEIDMKKKKDDDPKKKKPKRKPLFVKAGAAVLCRIQVSNLICVENFADYPQLGRFTLRTEGRTIAVGKVVALPPAGSSAFSP